MGKLACAMLPIRFIEWSGELGIYVDAEFQNDSVAALKLAKFTKSVAASSK
jgi:hypothetical protein